MCGLKYCWDVWKPPPPWASKTGRVAAAEAAVVGAAAQATGGSACGLKNCWSVK